MNRGTSRRVTGTMLPHRLPPRYHEVMKRFSVALFLASVALGSGIFLWTRPPRDLVQELASDDPEVVVAAARQIWLDSVEGVDHGPELAAGLKHESPRIRARCLKTLQRLNLNAYADAVVPLLQDPVESVRIQAAVALRDLRGYRDPAPLLAVFRDRSQADRVRVDVAWSLAERGERTSAPAFAEVAADRSEPGRVRVEAVRSLATLRVADQVPLLSRLVRDEAEEPRLRRAAMLGLGKLPTPESRALALQVLADEKLAPRLRGEAAQALGCHQDPANVPVLESYLAPRHDLLVRLRAAKALCELDAPPQELAALVEEGLASPDAHTRSESACLAVESAEPGVLETVKAALQQEGDAKVKCELQSAVCKMEGRAQEVEVDPDAALAP